MKAAVHQNGFSIIGFFCCLVLFGCLAAPVKLPQRTRGAGQEGSVIVLPDLSFIKLGTTRVEEVKQKLSAIDTGYSNPQLFWGRWATSSWGWYGLASSSDPLSVGGRWWYAHNLLLTFDPGGVVVQKETINSEPELWEKLRTHVSQLAPLDLSTPLRIPCMQKLGPKQLTLSADRFTFSYKHVKDDVVKFPLRFPMVIRPAEENTLGDFPQQVCAKMVIRTRQWDAREHIICTSSSDFVTVIHYFSQVEPSSIRWSHRK